MGAVPYFHVPFVGHPLPTKPRMAFAPTKKNLRNADRDHRREKEDRCTGAELDAKSGLRRVMSRIIYGGFHKWEYPHSWLVDFMEHLSYKWMGTLISGNPDIYLSCWLSLAL